MSTLVGYYELLNSFRLPRVKEIMSTHNCHNYSLVWMGVVILILSLINSVDGQVSDRVLIPNHLHLSFQSPSGPTVGQPLMSLFDATTVQTTGWTTLSSSTSYAFFRFSSRCMFIQVAPELWSPLIYNYVQPFPSMSLTNEVIFGTPSLADLHTFIGGLSLVPQAGFSGECSTIWQVSIHETNDPILFYIVPESAANVAPQVTFDTSQITDSLQEGLLFTLGVSFTDEDSHGPWDVSLKAVGTLRRRPSIQYPYLPMSTVLVHELYNGTTSLTCSDLVDCQTVLSAIRVIPAWDWDGDLEMILSVTDEDGSVGQVKRVIEIQGVNTPPRLTLRTAVVTVLEGSSGIRLNPILIEDDDADSHPTHPIMVTLSAEHGRFDLPLVGEREGCVNRVRVFTQTVDGQDQSVVRVACPYHDTLFVLQKIFYTPDEHESGLCVISVEVNDMNNGGSVGQPLGPDNLDHGSMTINILPLNDPITLTYSGDLTGPVYLDRDQTTLTLSSLTLSDDDGDDEHVRVIVSSDLFSLETIDGIVSPLQSIIDDGGDEMGFEGPLSAVRAVLEHGLLYRRLDTDSTAMDTLSVCVSDSESSSTLSWQVARYGLMTDQSVLTCQMIDQLDGQPSFMYQSFAPMGGQVQCSIATMDGQGQSVRVAVDDQSVFTKSLDTRSSSAGAYLLPDSPWATVEATIRLDAMTVDGESALAHSIDHMVINVLMNGQPIVGSPHVLTLFPLSRLRVYGDKEPSYLEFAPLDDLLLADVAITVGPDPSRIITVIEPSIVMTTLLVVVDFAEWSSSSPPTLQLDDNDPVPLVSGQLVNDSVLDLPPLPRLTPSVLRITFDDGKTYLFHIQSVDSF